ncbi:hypothetical protein HJG60_010753 [Phyllostomus discolor]|uniref:Uncharacterized protein n=1 Tax=Phyllostomus discolor TaxID=89673 RepID=A0A834ADF2_9CHIR|nr:hypothetical protein HJG60_010753 [Phyllostomus discolor]
MSSSCKEGVLSSDPRVPWLGRRKRIALALLRGGKEALLPMCVMKPRGEKPARGVSPHACRPPTPAGARAQQVCGTLHLPPTRHVQFHARRSRHYMCTGRMRSPFSERRGVQLSVSRPPRAARYLLTPRRTPLRPPHGP